MGELMEWDDMRDGEALELLQRFRRDLHRIPELDFDLPKTIAYIERVLSGLCCEVTHPCKGCICAYFEVRPGAPTTAMRADMDALPIAEATGCGFSSEHAGRMHACGHDAHMAMALTTAVYVDRALRDGVSKDGAEAKGGMGVRTKVLPRNILFVFQPAEETTGGARLVCESGVFERYGVDRIFGFHVWPDLPAGTVASRPGALLARSSETHVAIHGESVHIAKTYGVSDVDSHDALLAAARFAVGERWLMKRLAVDEPCVCTFGQLEAGTVCNAVAGEARLAGSLRVFSDAMFDRAKGELRSLLEESCTGTGCTGEIAFADGYPPVENDAALFGLVASALPELHRIETPLLIAEDFSFYQRYLPGVFFLLGVGEPDASPQCGGSEEDAFAGPTFGSEVDAAVGSTSIGIDDDLGFAHSALHTDTLMFDERILLKGLSVYRRLLRIP